VASVEEDAKADPLSQSSATEENEAPPNLSKPSSKNSFNAAQLSEQLSRDSAEQYLFMVEYMRQAGKVWSPVITALYLYSFAMIALVACILLLYGDSVDVSSFLSAIIEIVFQVTLYLVFPTLGLAHANSFISPMLEQFTNCAPEDFAVIGE